MKNTIKHFAGAGLATVMLLSVGCNDDPTEVYVADLYQKAYITTGIAPADEYTYKGTYALGGVQMNGTKLEYLGPNLLTTLGTGYVFDIYLCTAYAAKNPVSGTLYVPENAEELVAQYNSRGGTEDGNTGGYLLMTPDRYEITVPQSTVAAGEKQAPAFQVSLNAEMDWSAGKYLLPVCCTLDAGSEVTLSENASTVYLKVEMQRDIAYKDLTMLTPEQYSFDAANAGTTAPDAFDENNGTSWNGANTSEYVDVTFDEPVYLSKICFVGLSRRVYPYLRYEGEETFSKREQYIGNNNATVQALYTYDPTTNSGAPMDPYQKVAGVRFQFQNRQGGSIGDVYFITRDLANMQPQGMIAFDAGTTSYTLSKTWGFQLVGTKVEAVANSQLPETSAFDISLRSYASATSAMRGRLSVPENAEAAVTAYNTANNTSYTLLPADYYSIENAEATIESGNDRSTQPFRVQLNEEALSAITQTTNYLLPVSLTMESGAVDADHATLYIPVNITLGQKYRVLKPEEIAEYDFCPEDLGYGYTGGAYSAEYALEYAFDQNSTTAFMGDGSANYDYGIDEAIYVNFASAMQIHSIIFVNQTLATGWDTSYCPWYLSIGWAPYSESNFNWYIEYTQEGNLFEYNINRNISTVYIDYNMYDDYLSGFADVYFTVPDEE